MYKERLENVVRVLEGYPKLLTVKDLGHWKTCLSGILKTDDWFNSQGLMWDEEGCPVLLGLNGDYYGRYEGYEAVEQFFNISMATARYIFSQYSYFENLANGELEYEIIARLQQVLEFKND